MQRSLIMTVILKPIQSFMKNYITATNKPPQAETRGIYSNKTQKKFMMTGCSNGMISSSFYKKCQKPFCDNKSKTEDIYTSVLNDMVKF